MCLFSRGTAAGLVPAACLACLLAAGGLVLSWAEESMAVGDSVSSPVEPDRGEPIRPARYASSTDPADGEVVTLVVEPLLPVPARPAPAASAALPPYELIIPVAGVRAADLVDSFSQARGGSRRHLAIDIPAPTGTPVYAATSGTVLRKHLSARGGITLYLLDQKGDYVFYYAHLDGYAEGLRPGDPVEQGQVVGFVGHTGNAHESLPHLHFAIWQQEPGGSGWGGRAVNPYLVLTRQSAAD